MLWAQLQAQVDEEEALVLVRKGGVIVDVRLAQDYQVGAGGGLRHVKHGGQSGWALSLVNAERYSGSPLSWVRLLSPVSYPAIGHAAGQLLHAAFVQQLRGARCCYALPRLLKLLCTPVLAQTADSKPCRRRSTLRARSACPCSA